MDLQVAHNRECPRQPAPPTAASATPSRCASRTATARSAPSRSALDEPGFELVAGVNPIPRRRDERGRDARLRARRASALGGPERLRLTFVLERTRRRRRRPRGACRALPRLGCRATRRWPWRRRSAEIGLFLDGLRCARLRAPRGAGARRGAGRARGERQLHHAARARALRPRAPPIPSACRARSRSSATRPCPTTRPASSAPRSAARGPPLVRLLVAAFLAANVMLVSAALYIGSYSDLDDVTRRALRWLVARPLGAGRHLVRAPFWRGALVGPPAPRDHHGRARRARREHRLRRERRGHARREPRTSSSTRRR